MVDPVSLLVGAAGVTLIVVLLLAGSGLYVTGRYHERNDEKVVHLDDVRAAHRLEDDAIEQVQQAEDRGRERYFDASEKDRRQQLEETAADQAERAVQGLE
jgi:hypothetical protein